jgi:excisionase family DNA binding protein
MKNLLTVAETAEALNVKISTLRAWLARRKFPRVNCGRAVRIPADATVPAKEEPLRVPRFHRVPEVHRAPGEFDELPDELPDGFKTR